MKTKICELAVLASIGFMLAAIFTTSLASVAQSGSLGRTSPRLGMPVGAGGRQSDLLGAGTVTAAGMLARRRRNVTSTPVAPPRPATVSLSRSYMARHARRHTNHVQRPRGLFGSVAGPNSARPNITSTYPRMPLTGRTD